MGIVKIMPETTKDPISLIGRVSGTCYGSDVSNEEKNYKRGLENVNSGHGRTMEYPQVYLEIDGYSARVMRELYTHIGGAPSRLQASTRYINYKNFDYYIPTSILKNDEALMIYQNTMEEIMDGYVELEKLGISKEDIANILPLGMTSKVILRTNLRNLVDMAHQRLCVRAYKEYRDLMADIAAALCSYSDEWKYLIQNLFVPKCEVAHYCGEAHGCGKYPSKEEFLKGLKEYHQYKKQLIDDLK